MSSYCAAAIPPILMRSRSLFRRSIARVLGRIKKKEKRTVEITRRDSRPTRVEGSKWRKRKMGSFGAAIERKEAVVSLDGAKLILEGEREGCFPHSVALGLHSKDWSRLTRGSTLLNVQRCGRPKRADAVDNQRITIAKTQWLSAHHMARRASRNDQWI